MSRREFISLLGSAAAVWPLAAYAQSAAKKIQRVGIIDNQDETFSAVGDTLPRKWWRDILAFAGVL